MSCLWASKSLKRQRQFDGESFVLCTCERSIPFKKLRYSFAHASSAGVGLGRSQMLQRFANCKTLYVESSRDG